MLQKKQMLNLTIAACFVTAVGATGTAAASDMNVQVEYWKPSVSGEIKTAGSTVKADNNLGIEKKSMPSFSMQLRQNDHQSIFLQYENATFRGNKTIGSGFNWEDRSTLIGDKLSSKMETNHFRVGLRNEKISGNSKFSTIYSYTHGKIKTEVNDETAPWSRSKENSINAFGIGFAWETLNSKGINFFAEINPLAFGPKHQGYWEHKAGIKANLGSNMGLTVGYKWENIGNAEANGHKDIMLKGMFASLSSTF